MRGAPASKLYLCVSPPSYPNAVLQTPSSILSRLVPMGVDSVTVPTSSQLNIAREEIEVLERLRQKYPTYTIVSPVDDGSVTCTAAKALYSPISANQRTARASLSSNSVRSTASTRSSASFAACPRQPSTHHSTGSYHSSIPSISERPESPEMFQLNITPSLPHPLSRSVSEYSLRDRASTFRSFPSQQSLRSPLTYFCTYCTNGFESRMDWETHEWLFHERQSYWPCPRPGCEAVFDSGKSFELHHEARHNCLNCKHAADVVQLLPERKAWACGFDQCKAVFVNWTKRCKHVANHYEGLARRHGNNRETPEWTYSTFIRNLLRLPEVGDSFKRFMIKCHGHSKSTWPELEWLRDDTGELRRCLEYRDFRRGIPEIIHLAYRLGHPAYNAAVQVMSRPPTPRSERTSRTHSRVPSEASSSGTPFSPISNPGSPLLQSRSIRPYLYERKPFLVTLPEREPVPFPTSDYTKDYNIPRSLPSSPPDASPPHTRATSPVRAASIRSDTSLSRLPARRRMVARDADVKGTGCAALIHFLRQGPPDSQFPAPVLEHSTRPYTSPRLPMYYEQTIEETVFHESPATPVSKPVSTSKVSPMPYPALRAPPTSPTNSPLLALAPTEPPLPTPTPLSLWPRPVSPSTWTAPELLLPFHASPNVDSISRSVSLVPKPLLPDPPHSPLPDMTGMHWPLPPPTVQRPRVASAPIPRPATAGSEQEKRVSASHRAKARPLRWVSLSSVVEPPLPSPNDVDFGSCLTQPLDMFQPVPTRSRMS